jgi:hypothetical protein
MDQKTVKQAEHYAMLGLKVLHAPQTRDGILTMLKSAGDKVTGVAMATVQILSILDAKNKNVDDVVRVVAGNIIMGELIEVGLKAGIIPDFSEQEKAEAGKQAIKMYIQQGLQSGKYTKEEIESAIQSAQGEKQPEMPQKPPQQPPQEQAQQMSPQQMPQMQGGQMGQGGILA